MRDYRKVWWLFIRQFISSFARKRILAGYLIGIGSTATAAYHYNQFIGTHTMNIFEAFLQNYMTLGGVTLMLFGFIIVISDAPFVYEDSFMMIHRTGRKQWYMSMWLYMAVQGITYYLTSFLVTAVVVIQKSYIDNIWSQPLTQLIQYNQLSKIQEYHLVIPGEGLLMDYTPYSAMLHTFMFMLLYSLLLGGVLFAFNMYRHTAAGTIMAALIHIGGMVISYMDFVFPGINRWSFIVNVMFIGHLDNSIAISFSYILFILCIWIVYDLGKIFVSRIDYTIVESVV